MFDNDKYKLNISHFLLEHPSMIRILELEFLGCIAVALIEKNFGTTFHKENFQNSKWKNLKTSNKSWSPLA